MSGLCVCVCSGSEISTGRSPNASKKLAKKLIMSAAAFCYASKLHTGEACNIWPPIIVSQYFYVPLLSTVATVITHKASKWEGPVKMCVC